MTVVLLSDEHRRREREALAALAPVLRPYDNVVLLDGRRSLDAPASWREPRANGDLAKPERRPRERALLAILDDRVALSDGLLDVLVSEMADTRIGALGAQSNVADGDDLCPSVPYPPGAAELRRSALASWARDHDAPCRPAAHLGGPCVLVRRDHLQRAGGLPALSDARSLEPVLQAAVADGLGLFVSERAYAHHPGGPPRLDRSPWPLVSACLIVKDEQEQLPSCFAALEAVADEIVVNDTGSADDTIPLARRLGAHVVEGSWDGDFARARNAALDRCRGQWILWVDADEVLRCEDPAALRALLEGAPSELEGYVVHIDNLQGTEAATAFTHPAVRLFRRNACQWEGHLHEQVIRRADKCPPHVRLTDATRIEHRGYLQQALRTRAKSTRNLTSAFSDLAGGSDLPHALRLLNLARSYNLTGRFAEGADLAERAVELAERPSTARMALRALADALSGLGEHERALDVADELRRRGSRPVLADLIEGRAHLDRGDPEKALSAFARIDRVLVDDDGFEYRPSSIAGPRATALIALGRHGDAADVLLTTLNDAGGLDTHLGLLVEALEAAGRSLGEVYDALPPGRLLAFVPQLLQLRPDAADRVLEAWFERDTQALPILATAARLATRLAIERRLVWSARLRAKGLSSACPLVASAACPLPAADRVLAAAVAYASFEDPRALAAFVPSVLDLPVEERHVLRSQLGMLAPALVPVFDDLGPVVAPQHEPPASPRASGVAVVTSRPSGLRAVALAASLARQGHEVALAHPEPASSTVRVLERLSVCALAWPNVADQDWRAAAGSLLAHVHAASTISFAVLLEDAEQLAPALSEIVPGATVLLGDDARLGDPSILDVVGSGPPIEDDARQGICIVAADAGDGPATSLGTLLTALEHQLADVPVWVTGTDPGCSLAAEHPWALFTGPLADPSPWVRSARALVLLGGSEAPQWSALARAARTPVVLATADSPTPAVVAQIAAALGSGGDAVQENRGIERPTGAPPTLAHDDAAVASSSRPVTATTPCVVLDGPLGGDGETARVNRALARVLGDPALPFELALAPASPGSAGALVVRAADEPSFQVPRGAQLVLVQSVPFDGAPPRTWIGPMRDVPREIWVPDTASQAVLVNSGVPEEKVHVLPLDVDTCLFQPTGPRRSLRHHRATTFLFSGQANEQSGLDALLEAYVAGFSPGDDVSLVIHLEQGGTPELERVARQAAAAHDAPIELVEGPLSDEERADLYRACSVLVRPCRARGFAPGVAEAMASGLALVATDGTVFPEGTSGSFAWLVEARRVPAMDARTGGTMTGSSWLEPRRAALVGALREAAVRPERVQALGAAARAHALAGRDANAMADVVQNRLTRLLGSDRSTADPTSWPTRPVTSEGELSTCAMR